MRFSSLFSFHSQKDVLGKDCILTEPIYNTKFDFKSLYSDLGHKINGENNDFLELNVCGNIPKKCAGSDAAACFHLNGKEIKFGNENGKKNLLIDFEMI